MYNFKEYPFKTLDELLQQIEKIKNQNPYLKTEFNSRPYEIFHVLGNDNNPRNIQMINQKVIDHYIIKPECWICTFKSGSRPMPCAGTPECRFTAHDRLPKSGKPKRNISVETRTIRNHPLTIKISRSNLSFCWFHRLPFIVRTCDAAQTALHHIKIDEFYDLPGSHAIVWADAHSTYHGRIKSLQASISKCMLTESNDKIFTDELIEILNNNNVTSDPIIMNILQEISQRNFLS